MSKEQPKIKARIIRPIQSDPKKIEKAWKFLARIALQEINKELNYKYDK